MGAVGRAIGFTLAVGLGCSGWGAGTDGGAPGSATSSGAPSGAAAAGDAVVLRPRTFPDPGMGGMDSHTVLVPDGWEATGSAYWAPPALFNVVPTQDLTLTAPDGRRVRIGPSLGFVWFDPAPGFGVAPPKEGGVDNGYPVMRLPGSPDAWAPLVVQAVQQNDPGATDIRVTGIVPVPEVTAVLEPVVAQIRQQQQALAMPGARSFAEGQALGASATYTRDGQAWDTMFVFGVVSLGSEMQFGRQTYWTIEPNLGFRAPKGALEGAMPLLMSLAFSVQPTPQWAAMRADHLAKMQGIAAKGHQDRMRIVADTNREVARIRDDAFQQRMASMDETQRRFVNGIREVDDFVGGDAGSAVKLPSGYDSVFTDGQGGYLLTNQAGYDPNADAALWSRSWETMQRVE